MRFRVLVVVPLLWAAALVVGMLALAGEPAFGAFLRAEMELAKAMPVVGAVLAAFAFSRGEYLRRAWLFYGAAMLLLLARDAVFGLAVPEGVAWRGAARGGATLLANASAVVGTWMLARAWKVAGLELPGPRWAQHAVLAAAVVLSLASAGSAVVVNFQRLLAGEGEALVWIASGLGDLVILVLIAPLLLTALALRGGLLGWPWALLTTSSIAWLCFDGTLAVLPLVEASPWLVTAVSETFRSLACLFAFSAGVAQRFAILGVKNGVRPG